MSEDEFNEATPADLLSGLPSLFLEVAADRMNFYLGMKMGEFIPDDVLKQVAALPIGSPFPYNGSVHAITPGMKSLAMILLKKV